MELLSTDARAVTCSVGGWLHVVSCIQGEAFDMSPADEDNMRYLRYPLFDRQQFLILNYSLYSHVKKWSELVKYLSQAQELLCVFEGLSDSVLSLLRLEEPCPPALTAAYLGENEKQSLAEQQPRNVPPSFANIAVLRLLGDAVARTWERSSAELVYTMAGLPTCCPSGSHCYPGLRTAYKCKRERR